MAYLLGIDAGTTMVKTAFFDEEKGAVASAGQWIVRFHL